MKRKGFLAILTAMAMIGSMGVCVYAADDVMADYTGKADYRSDSHSVHWLPHSM